MCVRWRYNGEGERVMVVVVEKGVWREDRGGKDKEEKEEGKFMEYFKIIRKT